MSMFFVKYIVGLIKIDRQLLSVSDISVGKDEVALGDYDRNITDASSFIQGEVNTLLENPYKIREQNDEQFSIMDLRSLRIRTDKSIKEFVSKFFGIDLEKKDGMITFNRLYRESIGIYEERYLRNVPRILKEFEFTCLKDIKDFLGSTGEGLLGTYRCDLVKLFFSIAKSQNNIQYRGIKEIHQSISERVFRGIALLPDNPVNVSGSKTINSKFKGVFGAGGTEFTGFDRYKSLPSIVGKEIANIRYNSIEDFKDLHGFTFRVKTKDDVLRLIEYFLTYKVIDSIDKIDVMFMFSEDEIKESTVIKDETKRIILSSFESINPDEKRKEKGTSEKYCACSIKGKMKFKDPNDPGVAEENTGVEFKIELEDNENEYGTSFHGVLEIMKVFRELTRLSGVIRFKDVVNQVNNFFDTLSGQLEVKGKEFGEYLNELYSDLTEQGYQTIVTNWYELGNERKRELLERSLLRYVIKDLVPVKLNRRKRNVYFVHSNYIKQSNAGIQPELVKVKIKVSE